MIERAITGERERATPPEGAGIMTGVHPDHGDMVRAGALAGKTGSTSHRLSCAGFICCLIPRYERDSYDRDYRERGPPRRYDDGPRHDDGPRGGYRDRDYGRHGPQDSGPRGYRDRDMDYSRRRDDAPAERPRLQLQPRSKPREEGEDKGSSAIFGGAKPVDTAAKEKEIEERLQKKKEEEQREKERREVSQC